MADRVDIQRGDPVRSVDNYGNLIGLLNPDGETWSFYSQDQRMTFSGGALNVVLTNPLETGDGKLIFGQATSVPSGSETTVVTYTVPTGKTLYFISGSFSGQNLALFTLYINGAQEGIRRTYWGNFNGTFDFTSGAGIKVSAGNIIKITVIHNRPAAGDFDGTLYGVLM